MLLSLIQKVRNILGLLSQISHFELVALLQRMFATKMEPLVCVSVVCVHAWFVHTLGFGSLNGSVVA